MERLKGERYRRQVVMSTLLRVVAAYAGASTRTKRNQQWERRMEKNLIFAGVGFSTNSRIRPDSGLLLLRSRDFIEIPQRIITDGYHLVIAGEAWLGRGLGPRP